MSSLLAPRSPFTRLGPIATFLPLLLVAILVCLPVASLAKDGTDAEYRAAVKKLLVVQKTPQSVADQVTFSIAQQTLGSLAASGYTITETMQSIVFDQAKKSFGDRLSDVDTLAELYAPIYADNYSKEELLQLIAFWESPVGAKTIDVMPEMTKASFAVLDEASSAHLDEFQKAVDARFEEAMIILAP